MDPLTVDPEQSLMSVLQNIQTSAPPKPRPQGQLSQAGALMSGFATGFLGTKDPVQERAYAEQETYQRYLSQVAQISSVVTQTVQRKAEMAMRDRQLTLAEAKETRLEEQAKRKLLVDTGLKGLESAGDEVSARIFSQMLVQAGVVDGNAVPTLVKGGLAKSLPERLSMTIGAIENGLNPTEIGVNTTGIDIPKLMGLSKEARQALLPADTQEKLAKAMKTKMEASIEGVKADAALRLKSGTATEDDRRLLGMVGKGTDGVMSEILVKYYRGDALSQREIEAAQQYQRNLQFKGLTGDSMVNIMAAMGDPAARRALENMPLNDKALGDNDVLVTAAQIKAKVKEDPNYPLSPREKGFLVAAEDVLKRKNAKPAPKYLTDKFTSINTIMDTLDQIDDLVNKKGGKAFLGPVMGNVGIGLEKLGMTNPVRAELYTAINFLLAEVGPDKFGGQFTEGEKKIVRDFITEIQNPSGNFAVRLKSFQTTMNTKLRDYGTIARSGNYAVDDTLTSRSARKQMMSGQDPVDAEIDKLLMDGASPADIRKKLGR